MATQGLLETIVSPKIVGDGSGGYVAKTDIINIDNLVVHTINGLPPSSGITSAVGLDGKFIPTGLFTPLDLNGHSLTDSMQDIQLGTNLNMNGYTLTAPTAVKLGSTLDVFGHIITNSYIDPDSLSNSVIIDRNTQVRDIILDNGIISSNYKSGLIDIHDTDNCGCTISSLRMDGGQNNYTYLDMNGQVFFDNTGTLNIGYAANDKTVIRGTIGGDSGTLILETPLDMNGHMLTDSTQTIKLGNNLDLNGNTLTNSAGNVQLTTNLDLINNSLTSSTDNLHIGTSGLSTINIGSSSSNTYVSGGLLATNATLTTPFITGVIDSTTSTLQIGKALDLNGSPLVNSIGTLKIGDPSSEFSSSNITIDCNSNIQIGGEVDNISLKCGMNITVGEKNNNTDVNLYSSENINIESNNEINIGNGSNTNVTISASEEVYLTANENNVYIGDKGGNDSVYLKSATTFNANTGQVKFPGSSPVQVQNSKISPTSMVFVTPTGLNFNQNTNDPGAVVNAINLPGNYKGLRLDASGPEIDIDPNQNQKIMFNKDFLGIKGNVYYVISQMLFVNYGNYNYDVMLTDYSGVRVFPTEGTISGVSWKLEETYDLSTNIPKSYSVMTQPGFGFTIHSSNNSDKSTINYFISY